MDDGRTDDVRLRLASLVDSAQDAIMSADLDGRIATWNRAAEKLFGYPADEAIGRPAAFLKPPELQGRSGDKIARVRRGDAVPAIETVRRSKDGRDIEVSITHSPIHDPQGNLLGTSIVVRDLTEQRKAEAARFHLAAMIESSGAAILGVDLEANVTSWNAAAERLFGYPADEAIGRPAAFLVPPGEDRTGSDAMALLRQGVSVPPYDAVRRRKDGTLIDVSITPSLIRDAAGSIVGWTAFAHDISERKRSERELAAAHEATLIAGREYEAFAYAVAHDLRAPLRGIDGFVYLGREQYESGDPDSARAHLDRARAAAVHMGRLIDSLLRLAQVSRQLLVQGEVDLSDIALAVVARLRDDSPERSVEVTIQPDVRAVGDPDLLGVVLTNLLNNAFKFTRHHPAARIEFGRAGDTLYVTDNGAGFDMAHYDKLFGVFQRLHDQSQFEGTGIGLATCQRIIQRHGGHIWAEGLIDHGTTFSFTVPSPAPVAAASELGARLNTY